MLTRILGVWGRGLLWAGVLIIAGSGLAAGQSLTSYEPPAWSVGDWWTVQSQVYDEGKIVRGAKPGWRSPQTWRFQVEKMDKLADQDYYVVSITPGKGNSCPYSFRYWFRVSDRFVGRRELLHPTPAASKPRVIGPPAVAGDFYDQPAAPHFSEDFPSLPATFPLFGATAKTMALGITGAEPVAQKTEEVPLATMMEKASPQLKAKNQNSLAQGNLLMTITKPDNVKESQYWNQGLPFPVYGERVDNTYTSRRYWLVDAGKK